MLQKFKGISKKKLLLLALALTLLSGLRRGEWGKFIGGDGYGFPLYFIKIVKRTDVIPIIFDSTTNQYRTGSYHISQADVTFAIVSSLVGLIGDIIFWFLILVILRGLTKKFI